MENHSNTNSGETDERPFTSDVCTELSVGDVRTIVVEKTAEETDSDPLARINGIVVFVKGAAYLSRGETVEIKITEIQPNVAIAILNG